MQAIITLVVILSYALILLQYKSSSKSGARDIVAALSGKDGLQLLNRRTINSAPLLILSLVLCLVGHQNVFLQVNWNEAFAPVTISLICLCFFVSVYSGNKSQEKTRRIIPIQETAGYLAFRIPGLVIYEIFFRGVLLGIFLEWLSIFAAIACNLVLYALAHLFSARREFFGSFLFGFVLCWVTISNHSVYPAVLLHLCLALPYETIVLTKHQLLTKKL